MHISMVGVWDSDPAYASRLTNFITKENQWGISAVCYETLSHLCSAVENGQLVLVLAGRDAALCLKQWTVPTIILTEDRSDSAAEVYKYQSAREILRRLYGMKNRLAQTGTVLVRPASRLRGVYSPLGGCLKTSLALVMGSVLAEEKHCLYLSLEAHSGFRTMFDRRYTADLSDLLAAVKQGGDIQPVLTEAVQSFGKLSYIPPVIWPEDIRQTDQELIKRLLRHVAVSGGYEEIILDVGNDLTVPEEILSWCDVIYRPEKNDVFSQAKLAEYDSYLSISGKEDIRTRMRPIPLSQLAGEIPCRMVDQWQRWEQMIPLVRSVLTEEAQDGV